MVRVKTPASMASLSKTHPELSRTYMSQISQMMMWGSTSVRWLTLEELKPILSMWLSQVRLHFPPSPEQITVNNHLIKKRNLLKGHFT